MQTIGWQCDQCKKETREDHQRSNWLTITRTLETGNRREVNLSRDFHFCGIGCLHEWATKVLAFWQRRKDEPHSNQPNMDGPFGNDDLPDVRI